tara:strand:- start:4 stop:378 length:375 start_codon:yes stop_codon:yes gene_type:complete
MNNYISTFYKSTFKFGGVASRTEYWMSMLQVSVLLLLGTAASAAMVGGSNHPDATLGILMFIWTPVTLATIIAGASIGVRRVRDLGISGYFYLALCFVALIPIIGGVIQLVVLCLPTNSLEGKL